MMRSPSVDWRIDGSLMQTAAQLLGDESDAGHSSSSHNPLIKPPALDSRPPTSNSLDVKQRNQLIRSTFKLSKVLGTTPQIVEEDVGEGSGEAPASPRRKLQRKSTVSGAPAIRRAISANPTPSRPPTNLSRSKSIAAPVLRVNVEPVSRSSSSSTSSSVPPPSPSSPLFIVPSTAELKRQQTRAKLAKLQRHLGENIPAELVAPPSPASGSRRMSVDVSPLRKATSNTLPKRSKSLWWSLKDPKEGRNRSFSARPSDGPLDKLPEEPLSERQKAINVRRAMKMAQVFGVPPPHALFQIVNSSTPDSTSELGVYGPSAPNAKASIASLAYMLDHDRDSLYDLLSGPDPDPGSMKSDVELEDAEPLDWPYERPQAGTSTSSGNQVGVTSSEAEMGEPSLPSLPSATSVVPLDISQYAAGSDPGAFKVRRRRAAKLSRFFGVGYQDLFASMLSFPASNVQPSPLPPTAPVVPTAVPETTKGATNVENLGRLAEEDIQNVMSRLRGLKAGA